MLQNTKFSQIFFMIFQKMCKYGIRHKHSISFQVLFCLITVLSHCFAQNIYDYSDYSYRHGRDYQYDDEYDDDYDKTGRLKLIFLSC